jgi:hypothetical protein
MIVSVSSLSRETDYRCVGAPEGKVAITADELRDAGPLRRNGGADIEVFQALQKTRFKFRTLRRPRK